MAKGAAAEARLRVTCADNISPAILDVDPRADRDSASLAHGRVVRLECDGKPRAVVVPLAVGGSGQKLTAGSYRVDYAVTNCLETDECFELEGGEYRSVERAAFVQRWNDDGADIEFLRSRVTNSGDLRVVYDLRCRENGFTFTPFATGYTSLQVRRAGRGWQRVQLRPVYIDTTVGEWYEDNTFATDRRVIRLAIPTS